MKNDYSLELTLTSDNEMDPPFTMTLPEESMVVPDLDIFPGQSWAKIPIYKLDDSLDENTWILGTLVSQEYYTYFDLSNPDGNITMGIGNKNPDFMRPIPPSPGPSPSPIPQQIKDNGVVIGLLFAIMVVTCLICCLLYKKR